MRSIALLLFAVLLLLAQSSPGVRVRASICLDKDRDCIKKGFVGFAPARVSVTYTIPIHKDNRHLLFGMVCTESEYLSSRQLDGDEEQVPQFIVIYPRVPEGECQAIALVTRADGSKQSARSEVLLIQAQH